MRAVAGGARGSRGPIRDVRGRPTPARERVRGSSPAPADCVVSTRNGATTSRPVLSVAKDNLEKQGLIERVPLDGRDRAAVLTERGRNLLDAHRRNRDPDHR